MFSNLQALKDFFLFRNFTMDSSISGLLLLQNKLDFLGLFDTEDHASSRPTLPAINVQLSTIIFYIEIRHESSFIFLGCWRTQ